jgi:hypothetical protein
VWGSVSRSHYVFDAAPAGLEPIGHGLGQRPTGYAAVVRTAPLSAVPGRRLAALACVAAVAACWAGSAADATPWHLVSTFGRHGVAGLPFKELQGSGSPYGPGPGDEGLLLAPGPQGSLFVGGYANSKKGAFLVARISARGRLVSAFGSGGVTVVPAIYSTPQHPPRMFALGAGELLIVGFDRAGQLTVVRLSARGQADRGFGHDGVVQYKLPDSSAPTVITAAAVEPDGDILAVYQHEATVPVTETAIAEGLGEGAIHLVRLLPSGALDGSFGHGGFLTASGQTPSLVGYAGSGVGWACVETIAPDGSLLLGYEQAGVPNGDGKEFPAVQQLDPTGADAPSFGFQGAVYLPFTPDVNSELCDAVFALPGGGVEAGFGGDGPNSTGVDLFRFGPSGALEPAFGGSGHVALATHVAALALGGEGETFALGTSGSELVVDGVLASGAFDPALGGGKGERFAANLSEPRDTVEALPGSEGMSVRVGEELVRLSR